MGTYLIAAIDAIVAAVGAAIGAAIDAIIDPILFLILGAFAALIASTVDALMLKDAQSDSTKNSGSGGYLTGKNYFTAIDNLRKGSYNVPTIFKPTNGDPLRFSMTLQVHIFDFWNTNLAIDLDANQSLLPYSNEPSNFKPSLGQPSTITGNANDFTISASESALSQLAKEIEEPDMKLPELFNHMNWKNAKNFKGLKIADLLKLVDKPTVWQLPEVGYMASIHIVKENDSYKIAWTNLDNDQDKKALPETDGDLIASFINENNNGPNYLNSFANERVYSDIANRYKWIETNWKAIQTGKQVTEKTPDQYFEDTVLKNSHIDLYQVPLNDADLINSFAVITSLFTPGVEASHLMKVSSGMKLGSAIINSYFSDKDPLHPIVQADV